MHGLGNDFVIFDNRYKKTSFNTATIQSLADRNYGIGFDQLALISENPQNLTAYHLLVPISR